MLITKFDPWNSKLCTCPLKYSLNPFTGCSHACIYCYITSYIPDAFHARKKRDIINRLNKELVNVDSYLTLSNSSDPYTPEEKNEYVTRGCLKILKDNDIPVLIVTKSDIVTRDIDIISDMNASVSMTITTSNYDKAKSIEPYAPTPYKRIDALRILAENDIPCSVRLDPIIPTFNDNDNDIEYLIKSIAPYVSHVISSTIKPRADSMKRISKIIDVKQYEWKRIGRSYYLPEVYRARILSTIESQCKKHRLSFSTCRENRYNNKISCDGSHLLSK